MSNIFSSSCWRSNEILEALNLKGRVDRVCNEVRSTYFPEIYSISQHEPTWHSLFSCNSTVCCILSCKLAALPNPHARLHQATIERNPEFQCHALTHVDAPFHTKPYTYPSSEREKNSNIDLPASASPPPNFASMLLPHCVEPITTSGTQSRRTKIAKIAPATSILLPLPRGGFRELVRVLSDAVSR